MDPLPLTVVIPARDEAGRIAECVAAHRRAADVIVVDNGSVDDTAEQARAAGARVVLLPDVTIAEARNAGAAAARTPWILALDTDERVTEALWASMALAIGSPGPEAWTMRRRNFYLGREQTRGGWGRDWVVRLYRRGLSFRVTRVHESLEPVEPLGVLDGVLDHEPYRDLSHHMAKLDRYARWGAEELHAKGRRATAVDLTLRPLWRFVRAWIVNGGILDGRFGLVTALLGAQTAFLKYAHLWALEQDARDRRGAP